MLLCSALAMCLLAGCDEESVGTGHSSPVQSTTGDAGVTFPATDAAVAGDGEPEPAIPGTPAPSSDAGLDTSDPEPSTPPTVRDAGTTAPPTEPPSGPCVRAREMWSDDFESDYSVWTGRGYGNPWGDDCQSNGLTTEHPHQGRYSNRSEIVCPSSSPDGVHRGYGGLQFSGDEVLPQHTNTGTGMDAPNGIVTTFWTWIESGYRFGNGRWVSLFTINPTCGYTERVITLGIDQPDGILRTAHHWPEGTSRIEPGAPAFPMGEWVRVTVYVNFYSGVMHVWQNGESVEHVTGITRQTKQMCQWHWGLYASGDNTDVVMYEDEKIIWKLEEPWTDWSNEPWLGESQAVCD